ncbi:hypothetical protein KQX54_009383 [Cotesia glomerata]|uniref:Uncharacterized protein n=1 Tax=Cotesia glomerata TaxID=32391 RepID=A0AAV7IIV6_COTGL|nr:hypothetical protein KQX54_009383 [Cotesia glomerata]
MLQLLHGNRQHIDDWPPHQVFMGHSGHVNCLLYPHSHSHQYNRTHLVSGSVDLRIALNTFFAVLQPTKSISRLILRFHGT